MHGLPPTWPRPLSQKQEQEGWLQSGPTWGVLLKFSSEEYHVVGWVFWWCSCSHLCSVAQMPFLFQGRSFKGLLISWMAKNFGNIHELRRLLPSFCPPPKTFVASNVFLFIVILQPTSNPVDCFYYMATWVLSFTTQSINRNWRNILGKVGSP